MPLVKLIHFVAVSEGVRVLPDIQTGCSWGDSFTLFSSLPLLFPHTVVSLPPVPGWTDTAQTDGITVLLAEPCLALSLDSVMSLGLGWPKEQEV